MSPNSQHHCTSTFKYEPLNRDNPQAFRVLNILPGSVDSSLHCELYNSSWGAVPNKLQPHHPLKTQPRRSPRKHRQLSAPYPQQSWNSPKVQEGQFLGYEALSYAWGEDDAIKQILLNGQCFHVTPTLEQALQSLRDKEQPKRIWIDAICINQNNDEEKASQVRQMTHIYANADQVLVWLGSSSFNSGLAIKFAKELTHLIAPSGGAILYSSSQSEIIITSIQHLVVNSRFPSWCALFQLFRRPWWSRAWVVQETQVAKNISFICGDITVSWRDMCQACFALKRIRGKLILAGYDGVGKNYTSACSNAYNIFYSRHNAQEKGHHWTFLDKQRGRKCKLPHDKIYSVLGLMPQYFQDVIPIDYGQPIENLYKLVTKCFIQESQYLNILLSSQHQLWSPQLPSWVPDWGLCRRMSRGHSNQGLWPMIKSAGFSVDLSELNVRGSKLDPVLYTMLEVELLPGTMRSDVELHINTNPIHPGPCRWKIIPEILAELFKPVLEDDLVFPKLAQLGDNRYISLFLNMLLLKKYGESYEPVWRRRLAKYHKELASITPESKKHRGLDFWHLRERIEHKLTSLTVFETRRFFGLAPDITEPGDLLCLLSGCRSQVILRPLPNGKYLFIGPALMDWHYGRLNEVVLDIRDNQSRLSDMVLV